MKENKTERNRKTDVICTAVMRLEETYTCIDGTILPGKMCKLDDDDEEKLSHLFILIRHRLSM
jgi:hypothetical protein